MMKTTVSIIIVNYKTPNLVIDCLHSIEDDDMSGLDYSIYIVDNFSDDDSGKIIRKAIDHNNWNDKISFTQLDQNNGFSFGNNTAIREVLKNKRSDYVWLLNPDTVIRKNACTKLIDFMMDKKNIGICGSRLEDPDGTPQIAAFRDFTIVSEMLSGFNLSILSKVLKKYQLTPDKISETSHKTAWVAGASMMLKTEVLQQIGLLDEKFFLYYEEVDLCVRARKSGWECWFVPESRVVHLVGASTGISDLRKRAPRRPKYWFESRRFFFLKNYPWFKLLFSDLLWITGYSLFLLRKKLMNKEIIDPPHFLGDFFKNSFFCKGWKI